MLTFYTKNCVFGENTLPNCIYIQFGKVFFMIIKSPFLQSLRDVIRVKRYSLQTEKIYLYWVKFFIMFNDKRHPKTWGVPTTTGYI